MAIPTVSSRNAVRIIKILLVTLICTEASVSEKAGSTMPASRFKFYAGTPDDDVYPTTAGLVFQQSHVLNETRGTFLTWKLGDIFIRFNFTTPLTEDLGNDAVIIFGLSKTGDVEGADVVAVEMAKLIENFPGSTDMYGGENGVLVENTERIWKLVNFDLNDTHVSILVVRPINACGPHNIDITGDLLRIIWGHSSSASISEFTLDGIFRAYLLDPMVVPSEDPYEVQSWSLMRKTPVPARPTSYWCTVHQGPKLSSRHHIVGFGPILGDEVAVRHVHHLVVHRCYAPRGSDPATFFEKYVNHPGEECYLEEHHELPLTYCTELIYVWLMGGTYFDFPHDLGFPLGEAEKEYFLFEVHYDNPESLADLVVDHGVLFHYSAHLREKEGGYMLFGTGLHGLHYAPPGVSRFRTAGQCPDSCTQEMVPSSGVNLVAGMLHSHSTGRQLTAKLFRGDEELPWLFREGNYDCTFQQNRLLPERVTILRGDIVSVQCELDTTSRNTTTVTGFSALDEMCLLFAIMETRLVPYFSCTSEYPTSRTMERYGIKNMTWSRERQTRIVNEADNPELVGLTFAEAVDKTVPEWTLEMIQKLELEQWQGEHEGACPALRYLELLAHGLVGGGKATGGAVPTEQLVEHYTPSTNTMGTSMFPVRKTRYPANAKVYTPENNCPE